MANFIKKGKDIALVPKGYDYELEPGKVYDLKIVKGYFGPNIKFTLNGEMNLPKKVYMTKKDSLFIKRVINNFNNNSSNTTGVLLTGEKGTGKSVTAKVLAKEANLPIIIIDPSTNEELLEDFFKDFNAPVCILFDEVDKDFSTSKLLTFLDGMHKTTKKLVVMTANDEDDLSIYIKNRCSRIRYYRKYIMKDDAREYASLICDNKGIEGTEAEEIVNFITCNIEYPSIDNISSFIDEVVFTKGWGLSLKEVLEFMNINVGEKKK